MTMDETTLNKLWEEFSSTKSLKVKHQLIMHYIWLVKYVLQLINLPTNSILDEEDFINIGILGLHEAIERFELSRGVKFESYAIPRIKGIIQDELRRLDWLSRTARKKAQDFIQAGDILRKKEGREVSSEEIRKKLNVSHDEYKSYLAAAAAAKASKTMTEISQAVMDEDDKSYIEEIADVNQDDIQSLMENEERVSFLVSYLQKLAEKKRLVMTLYYYENLTFKEIGNVLNVSESRVCQIHSQVLDDLKVKIIEFDRA
ncbi:MAG: FliA/WhiG family RNA polymerase sigma factor [Bacteroidetes bacterium]|nr:MAG: FliA/WhiG family RNA polymerase sigma factor [Bacteroidota bacterium]